MANKKKNPKSQLEKDLKAFSRHFKKLLKNRKLCQEQKELKALALEIEELNNDSLLAEEIDELKTQGHLVHHILATPWGAPFVSRTTLLDAALSLQYQPFKDSDLATLLDEFCTYSTSDNNEFIMVCDSILDAMHN